MNFPADSSKLCHPCPTDFKGTISSPVGVFFWYRLYFKVQPCPWESPKQEPLLILAGPYLKRNGRTGYFLHLTGLCSSAQVAGFET